MKTQAISVQSGYPETPEDLLQGMILQGLRPATLEEASAVQNQSQELLVEFEGVLGIQVYLAQGKSLHGVVSST